MFAAKQVQEKQEDLPFDEKLPPLAEPAILALETETGDAADAFFKRPKNMFEDLPTSEPATSQTEAAGANPSTASTPEPAVPETKDQEEPV